MRKTKKKTLLGNIEMSLKNTGKAIRNTADKVVGLPKKKR